MKKARKRRAVARGAGLDVVSPAIALAAAGLWALWPAAPPANPRLRSLPPPRARYVGAEGAAQSHMDPALFGLPSAHGFHATPVARGVVAVPPREAWPPPMLLDAPGTEPAPRASPLSDVSPPAVFQPFSLAAPAFTPPPPPPEWVVRLTGYGPLRAAALALPGFTEAERRRVSARGPCRVECFIRLAPDGRVDHVFLLSGTGDEPTDRLLIGKVESARASELADGKRSGRIVLDVWAKRSEAP